MKHSVQAAHVEGKFVRQSGGKGQYGHVWIKFTPQEQGAGYRIRRCVVGGVVPREYIGSVETGLKDAITKRDN